MASFWQKFAVFSTILKDVLALGGLVSETNEWPRRKMCCPHFCSIWPESSKQSVFGVESSISYMPMELLVNW
jgi:hypothetical protein